jgi:hypothetical protein
MQCDVCRGATLQPVTLDEGLAAHTYPDDHGTWISSGTYFTWLEQRDRASDEVSEADDPADVAEPPTAKIWLDAHSQQTLLLAFLNDPDPYKP